MQEMKVQSLGLKDPLEKEMTTHSSIHAWEIPWPEESWWAQSMGVTRVSHDLRTKQQQFYSVSVAFYLCQDQIVVRPALSA